MIFDAVTYNGEMECLKIRCEELKDLDVLHVIVEGRYTFTGKLKDLKFPSIEHEFKQYNIRYVIVDDRSIEDSAWAQEELQRNAIMRGLYDAKDTDVVIVSDVDEIPSRKAVEKFEASMEMASLRMDNFWYKFNCLTERQTWLPAKIMTYEYLKSRTPNEVRNSGHPFIIDDGGWHFSYLGDAKYIVEKLVSFSHQEYNQEQYIDVGEITRKINQGISLWGESQFEFVEIDDNFPEYLINNQKEFKHLIA